MKFVGLHCSQEALSAPQALGFPPRQHLFLTMRSMFCYTIEAYWIRLTPRLRSGGGLLTNKPSGVTGAFSQIPPSRVLFQHVVMLILTKILGFPRSIDKSS